MPISTHFFVACSVCLCVCVSHNSCTVLNFKPFHGFRFHLEVVGTLNRAQQNIVLDRVFDSIEEEHRGSNFLSQLYLIHVYRVGQKTLHFTFVHIFASYWSIFKIFSLAHYNNNIITNKHFGKIEKNTSDQHCSEWQCMTLNCVGLTQSSVIRIIHRNVGLQCFSHLSKFLSLSLIFADILISQSIVQTHLRVVGHITVTLLQIVCKVCQQKNLKIGQQLAKI